MARKPRGYWTKERCREEALKYSTRTVFKKGSGGAHTTAWENGWLGDICEHMDEVQKPFGYWQDKERCREEALKYSTRTAFKKGSGSAYSAAWKNGWLDDVCTHMVRKGHNPEDLCVVYEFNIKMKNGKEVVYIGITEAVFVDGVLDKEATVKKRYGNQNPEIQGMVFVNHGIYPRIYADFEGIPGSVVTREEALIIESESILVAVGDGNVVLNTIGNPCIYEKEELIDILNDNCIHGYDDWHKRLFDYEPVFRWTKECCREEALKYPTRGAFAEGSSSAYKTAWKNGWLKEFYMEEVRKPNGHWQNKECCHEEAKKYHTRIAFQKNSQGAYKAAKTNKWLNDICTHMEEVRKPNGHWQNKEKCRDEALKYSTRGAFAKRSGSAYNTARKNGWLDEFFPKM